MWAHVQIETLAYKSICVHAFMCWMNAHVPVSSPDFSKIFIYFKLVIHTLLIFSGFTKYVHGNRYLINLSANNDNGSNLFQTKIHCIGPRYSNVSEYDSD